MVKGAVFTIGVLSVVGGLGWIGISFLAAIQSDNTQDTTFQDGLVTGGIAAGVGVALCCLAGFVL